MRLILLVAAWIAAVLGAVVFVVAMIEAAMRRAEGEANDIRPNELHHAYLGALLLIGTAPLGGWRAVFGAWLAAALICDDADEHRQQLRRPAYQSLLHRWFAATLWRFAWIRWLAGVLNRVFGKAAP